MAHRGSGGVPAAARMGSGVLGADLNFLLARANAVSVAAANAALAVLDLRVRPYAVLAAVAEGARPSQRELSEFLRLDPSQIVALVDDLEDRGLISREQDPRDRRAKVVVATDAGQALFRQAQLLVTEAERELHAALDDRERAQLSEMLRRVAFDVG